MARVTATAFAVTGASFENSIVRTSSRARACRRHLDVGQLRGQRHLDDARIVLVSGSWFSQRSSAHPAGANV
jgi:hypothetical protein